MFSFLKKALGTETEVNASTSANDKTKTDVKTSATAVESDSKLLVNKIPTGINAKESTTVHDLSATVVVSSTPSPDAEDIDIPESDILKSAPSGVPSDLTLQGDAGAVSQSGMVNNLTDVRHEVPTQTAKDDIKLSEDLKKMVINEVPILNSDTVNAIEKPVPVTVPVHSDVMKSVQTAAGTEVHTSSTAPVLVPQTPTKDNGRSAAPTKGSSNEVSAAADDEDELQEDLWKTVTSPSKGLPATEKPNRSEEAIDTVKEGLVKAEFEGINSTGNTSKLVITPAAVKSASSPLNIIAVEPVKVTSADKDQSPVAALHSASSIIDSHKVADTAHTTSKESPLVTVSTPAHTSTQDVSHSSSSTSTTTTTTTATVLDTMKASKGEENKTESPLVTVSTSAHTSAQDVSHSSSSTSTTTVVDTKSSLPSTDIKKESTHELSVLVSHSAVEVEVEAVALTSSGDKIAGIPSIALPSALNSVSADSKNILPDADSKNILPDTAVAVAVAVVVANKDGDKDEVEDTDQLTAKKSDTKVIKIEKKNDADNDTAVKSANDKVTTAPSETNGDDVIISEIESDAALQVIDKSDEDDVVLVPTLMSGVMSEVKKKEEEVKEVIEKMEEVKVEKEEEDNAVEIKEAKEVKQEEGKEEEVVKKVEIKEEKGEELKEDKEVRKKETSVESKNVAEKSTEREIIVIDDSDDDNNETVKKVKEKVVIVIDDSDDDDDDEPVVAKSTAPRVVYTVDDDDDDDDDGNTQTQSSRSGSRPYRPATASAASATASASAAAAKKGSGKVKGKECPGLEAWETCINELDELEVIAREMQRDREEEGEDDEEDVDGEGEEEEDGEEDRWSDYNEELNGTADGNDDYDVNDDGDDMVQATAGDDQKDFGVDDEIAGVYLSDDEGEEEDNRGGGDRGGSSYRNDIGSNGKFPSSPPGLHTGNPRGTVYSKGSCLQDFLLSVI